MIPWDQIQVRWIQGESASAISNSLAGTPTRQGISKRAKKENWKQLPTVSKKHLQLSAMQLGQDTPENRRIALELLSEGVTYTLVSGVIGVSRNTLLNWRKADPLFAAQCRAARHTALADCAATVFKAKDKDWKAGKYILESAQESRGDYIQERGKEPIEIIININRDPSERDKPPGGVIIDGEVIQDGNNEAA